MLPDDAGRRDEHLLFGAAHSVGGDARHLAGMFEPGDARRGVRDAGVHHHGARGAIARGARTAIGEMLPRDDDGRGAEDVLRERARCRARLVRDDEREVATLRFLAETRMDAGSLEAEGTRNASALDLGECCHVDSFHRVLHPHGKRGEAFGLIEAENDVRALDGLTGSALPRLSIAPIAIIMRASA